MSRSKAVLRFVLALIVFVALSFPPSAMFTPPDPFTQLIVLGVLAGLVAMPLSVVFVQRSHSFRRLVSYLFAVNVLSVVIGLSVVVTSTLLGFSLDSGDLGIVAQAAFLVVVYVLAFQFVYRGGYSRLRTRFA